MPGMFGLGSKVAEKVPKIIKEHEKNSKHYEHHQTPVHRKGEEARVMSRPTEQEAAFRWSSKWMRCITLQSRVALSPRKSCRHHKIISRS